jgi:hypothetical protein
LSFLRQVKIAEGDLHSKNNPSFQKTTCLFMIGDKIRQSNQNFNEPDSTFFPPKMGLKRIEIKIELHLKRQVQPRKYQLKKPFKLSIFERFKRSVFNKVKVKHYDQQNHKVFFKFFLEKLIIFQNG